MDIKDFAKAINTKRRELDDLIRRRMPVIAGRMAKDHFQNNFRKGGFVDRNLQKWPPSKRLSDGGTSARSRYGTLLSSRNRLFNSIKYIPRNSSVTISTNVPYAAIHNNGGEKTTTVTPKMRKFAWRQFYKESGIRKNSSAKSRQKHLAAANENHKAAFWRNLALTKKTKITQKIPKRKFIGESTMLSEGISAKIETEIKKILTL